MTTDYVGTRFGRLVVKDVLQEHGKRSVVSATCDCGLDRTFRLDVLLRGAAKSCGCLRREKMRERRRLHVTKKVLRPEALKVQIEDVDENGVLEFTEIARRLGVSRDTVVRDYATAICKIQLHAPWLLDFWTWERDVRSFGARCMESGRG